MTDFVQAVGPFPEWAQTLRQVRLVTYDLADPSVTGTKTGSSVLESSETANWPDICHGNTKGDHSWLAQRGAAEILGLPPPTSTFRHLRTSIETIIEYWFAKMANLKRESYSLPQCIQDELEFNIANIPIHPDCNLPPLDESSKHTYAVLRPLITNFNCYVYAVEIQDALDRIDALDASVIKAGGQEVGREIEWIRYLAGLLAEEGKMTIRLFWAGGTGKDLVKLSLDKPWYELTNISKDMRLHLNKTLVEVEKESPFDAAFAGLCLNPEERGVEYGGSELTQMLAFEQMALAEENLGEKYPNAVQMAVGEYSLALELLSELPPLSLPAVEPSKPKTLPVRLNIAQSACAQICTATDFVISMCNREFATENYTKLWETLKDVHGIFARELGLTDDLIGKLYPFMSDTFYPARWLPLDEYGKPLNDSSQPTETVGTGAIIQKQIFEVNKKDYKMWKKLFRGDDSDTDIDELSSLFRSIGFVVERIGGSFNRFTSPDNAGTPFIIRVPVGDSYYFREQRVYPIPLAVVGHFRREAFGWDIDWFTVKREDGEIDEEEDDDHPRHDCMTGKHVFVRTIKP